MLLYFNSCIKKKTNSFHKFANNTLVSTNIYIRTYINYDVRCLNNIKYIICLLLGITVLSILRKSLNCNYLCNAISVFYTCTRVCILHGKYVYTICYAFYNEFQLPVFADNSNLTKSRSIGWGFL